MLQRGLFDKGRLLHLNHGRLGSFETPPLKNPLAQALLGGTLPFPRSDQAVSLWAATAWGRGADRRRVRESPARVSSHAESGEVGPAHSGGLTV